MAKLQMHSTCESTPCSTGQLEGVADVLQDAGYQCCVASRYELGVLIRELLQGTTPHTGNV